MLRLSTILVLLGSAQSFVHQNKVTPVTRNIKLDASISTEDVGLSTPADDIPTEEAPEIASTIMNVEMPMSAPDRIQPGRYQNLERSIALPFLNRPYKLDGSHAGDFGFDPFGFTDTYDLYTMQEAELRHARLAMLAVVGWPLAELVAPKWMLQGDYGCAPSVLNGFNPVSFLATAAVFAGFGYFEYRTALRKVDDKSLGLIHTEDMADVWSYGVAGDYNFDPLGLYSSIGDDAYARKGLRELEISHGRSAMLGITSFVIWEKLTGHPIVENSMFFHPNLLLPFLYASYVAFNQVYEVDLVDNRFIDIKMTSEGAARVENLRLSMPKMPSGDAETPQIVSTAGKKISSFAKNVAKNIDTESIAKDFNEKMRQYRKEYFPEFES